MARMDTRISMKPSFVFEFENSKIDKAASRIISSESDSGKGRVVLIPLSRANNIGILLTQIRTTPEKLQKIVASLNHDKTLSFEKVLLLRQVASCLYRSIITMKVPTRL